MKFSYLADGRDITVPAGFEGEYRTLMSRAGASRTVRITLENVEELRTRGMNDKFHAMCRELAAEAGDGSPGTMEYVKEMAKSMAVEYFGYPQLTDADGRLQYDADGRPRGMSTAEASAAHMTLVMDALRTLAVEYGYEWREE